MATNPPYTVLGFYYPKSDKAWRIGRDITRLTRREGLVPLDAPDSRYERAPWADTALHAHVRKRTLRKEDGAQWHQDGDYGHVPMDHGIVFWSNIAPTQFRVEDRIWQPQPYAIVLINNLECFHRRPPNAPRKRYLFRQRVENPF